MFAAGLVTRPSRGRVQITFEGIDALKANPERIDMKVLRGYESYRAFRAKKSEKTPSLAPATVVDGVQEKTRVVLYEIDEDFFDAV